VTLFRFLVAGLVLAFLTLVFVLFSFLLSSLLGGLWYGLRCCLDSCIWWGAAAVTPDRWAFLIVGVWFVVALYVAYFWLVGWPDD